MIVATVSVVVPVRDGERYLDELLGAVHRQGPDEVLVIDSGSTDSSVAVARARGARVVEIEPSEFGHGRTRNLGAERTSGDLICFLTQDATPVPGWLDAFREAFALADRVGAAYGPHLPREDTSPMIARELTDFFAGFSPNGSPVVQRAGDPAFLSNVNACYARTCWEEIRFDDVAYSEDQAFGRAMLAAGWAKVYHPRAAVLHAHDYPPVEFMRRYFDEYRGLRETVGHVETFGVRSASRDVRALVAGDRRWMRERGWGRAQIARWTARSAVHHGGRKLFSALGSRAEALPAPVQRSLSLERRAGVAVPDTSAPGLPATVRLPGSGDAFGYEAVGRVLRDGPAPLLDPVAGMADREQLHIAFVIPPFAVGSGGHNVVFQLVLRLERAGHTCSIWLHDPLRESGDWPAVLRRTIVEHFAPIQAPVQRGFRAWFGADVVVATGWQTVYPAVLLKNARARAYLVNDHEPEFYGTSAESRWAEHTYRLGLYGITGSPWLRDLYVNRYGGEAGIFEYGVDHETYFPRPIQRRDDTVVFYARAVTQRRAVPLGVLALDELVRRHPHLRVVTFGDERPVDAPFDCEHVGVASPQELSWLFSQATVGLCLSMTNYSLIPQEMLACGLPCVDLEGASAESVFGSDGPVELARFDPIALADAMERLLTDRERWSRDSRAGLDFARSRTWDAAAEQVERELRNALRARARS